MTGVAAMAALVGLALWGLFRAQGRALPEDLDLGDLVRLDALRRHRTLVVRTGEVRVRPALAYDWSVDELADRRSRASSTSAAATERATAVAPRTAAAR